MTRRPLQPRMSRLVRTTHAQTPSAKKASESPTARLGPVRPPRAAATPPVSIVIPPGRYDGFTWVGETEGQVGINLDYEFSDGAIGLQNGDTAVVTAFGVQCGWDVPAGWTVIASGAVGDMDYLVSYWGDVVVDSSVTLGCPDMSPGWTFDANRKGTAMVIVQAFGEVATSTSPVCSVSTLASATVHPLQLPPTTWAARYLMTAVLDGSAHASAPGHWPTYDPSSIWGDYYIEDLYNPYDNYHLRRLSSLFFDPYWGEPPIPPSTFYSDTPPPTSGSVTTTNLCTSVSIAVGFA